jgi:peptidoglycan/LPS O-acetylase OafA/YrhL
MSRIVRLEACRGLAAIVVMIYHLIRNFRPDIFGAYNTTVLNVFINGPAAVAFFFTLSGFVLTARFFGEPDPTYMAGAALKRLPRLALLTTIATVVSCLLWQAGLYHGSEAARVWPDFVPHLSRALGEGVWRTFTKGDHEYDPTLWTMTFEFQGSLLVFVLAPFLVHAVKSRIASPFFFAVALVLSHYFNAYMMFFIVGMAIAYYKDDLKWIGADAKLVVLLVAAGLYLLSYKAPDGVFPGTLLLGAWLAGTASIVLVVLYARMAEAVFDNKVGWFLGFISFPLYLIHCPVMWVAGTFAYVHTNGSFIAAIVATSAVTIALSIPLAMLDRRWTSMLNRWIGALFATTATAHA